MTITFPPEKLTTVQAALHKTGRAHCHLVSLYRYDAVLSYVQGDFQASETIQIIAGLDYSVTAAIMKV